MTGSILFWFAAAILTLGTAALVLSPLRGTRAMRSRADSDVAVYRDQLEEVDQDLARGMIGKAEADAARTEISRRLLAADAARSAEAETASRAASRFAWIMVTAVPVLAVLLYLNGGAPGMPSQPFEARISKPPEEQNLEELVARVEQHLRANPADAEGWKVIAPIYARLGRFNDAADAYGRIVDLNAPTGDILAKLGEALVFANEGLVDARTVAIFERALTLDPQLAQARYFMGLAAVQEGDNGKARAIWTPLLEEADPSSRWGSMVARSLSALDQPPARVETDAQTTEEAIAALPVQQRADAIKGMVDGLDARLADEGGSVEEWLQLMRARMVLDQQEDATAVLARALAAYDGDEQAQRELTTGAEALGLNRVNN